MNNQKIKKLLVSLMIIAAGIAFIIFGSISFKEVKNFPEVQAVVTKVETNIVQDDEGTTEEKTIYVQYTVDGVEYNEVLQNTSSNAQENETITVRYNPEKPEYVTGATKASGTLQLAVGIVIAVAGLASAVITFIKP